MVVLHCTQEHFTKCSIMAKNNYANTHMSVTIDWSYNYFAEAERIPYNRAVLIQYLT